MRDADLTDSCWRYIRKSRHTPPGNAKSGERKAVYTGAFEQAEQFFTTSDSIGKEIKPILLYYGLNQALRAMAAVSIARRETWTFTSHGLSCRNLDQIIKLSDLTVEASGKGAFEKLCQILGASRLESKVSLGDVWACLPEGATAQLQGSSNKWNALQVSLDDGLLDQRVKIGPHSPVGYIQDVPRVLVGMPVAEGNALIEEKYPGLSRMGIGVCATAGQVIEPSILNLDPNRATIPVARLPDYSGRRQLRLELDDMEARGYKRPEYGIEGSITFWTMPCLPGTSWPLHSLAAWYVVLYALSVVARYAPARWTAMVDINTSADAASIEYILSQAHQRCISLRPPEVAHR